jgi:hypothetical protein
MTRKRGVKGRGYLLADKILQGYTIESYLVIINLKFPANNVYGK